MHLLFAWRYFKAKKSTNAINVIAWISILAIIIGTAALILVLSVFNGFEDLVKSLYSSFYTDLKVSPSSGKIITITQQQLEQLKGITGINNYSMIVEEKAFLQNGESQSVMSLKAVDDNYRYVSGVADHIVNKGNYELGTKDMPELIVGVGIENALGIVADQNIFALQIYLPRKSGTESTDPIDNISIDTIHTSAAFAIQQDFDNKYCITNIDFAKKALRLGPDDYTNIEIKLNDASRADDIKKDVQKIFPGYKVENRFQQNQNLYSVMNMERWVIYGVLSLILIVAAFTMISALRMLILEKQKDINVLFALGGNKNFIQKIFLSEGMLLASIGGATGMFLALIIALAQIKYHLIPLQGGSFLIDYFPVKLQWSSFLLVGITVFVISLIASWLPSRKVFDQEFSLRSE